MHPLSTRVLSARLVDGRVHLSCQRGMADAVMFYCRRGAEPEFYPLADETEAILDDRPKLDPDAPEERRYYAILLYSGEENRMKSNEIVVLVP